MHEGVSEPVAGKAADSPLVVGIGELLWDIFPQGREVGGAPANFAYHAQVCGANGIVVSRVGDDDDGREIIGRIAACGLDVSHIGRDPDHATGTVTVELDADGKPAFTIHPDVAWDFIVVGDRDLDIARRASAVCFGTLARRSPVSRAAIGRFIAETGPECVKVLDINLRQDYFDAELIRDSLSRADALKLNDEELPVVRDTLGLSGSEDAVVGRLMREFSVASVALTRGARGGLVITSGGRAEHGGFPSAEVASTVGAGDAFTAAFVMGLLRGNPPSEICERANRLAAYVCSQPGAVPSVPAGIL